MFCTSVRWLRKKPTWFAKRRTELISGGRTGQTRSFRKRPRRELGLARRGKWSRTIITTSGMRTQVYNGGDAVNLFILNKDNRD